MTTPFPFPLVQMARTFLFFYVFTVPFALLSDSSNVFVHCIVIFILTFGFMGLEIISIELDDPFGDDANDFDNLGMAFTAFEDNYLMIYAIDGPEYADKLRAKMFDKRASDINHSEQTWLLASSEVV
jgi:predicted membrane chloride channel (bestrophin family)